MIKDTKTPKEHYALYKSKISDKDSIKRIVYEENSYLSSPRPYGDIGIDMIYTIQHQFAIRKAVGLFNRYGKSVFPGNESEEEFGCIDVGSQFDFVTVMSSFANFVMVDPSLNLPKEQVAFQMPDISLLVSNDEAQKISWIESESFCLLTSLHAIEHFGLGRYGDTIDPLGDIRGLKEFNRILKQGGYFIGSVPIERAGSERVAFNKNRIYSIVLIKKMLEDAGFNILEDLVALAPTSSISRQHPSDVKDKTVPASRLTSEEFEEAMNFAFSKDETFIKNPPDAAYIWLAQKNK